MAKTIPTSKPPSRVDILNETLTEINKACKLNSWNSFVEDLQVPSDLMPALLSQRAELIELAIPRAMNADEVAILYKLIGTLIETNMALRTHAKETARLVDLWHSNFKPLANMANQLQHFANFRRTDDEEMDD